MTILIPTRDKSCDPSVSQSIPNLLCTLLVPMLCNITLYLFFHFSAHFQHEKKEVFLLTGPLPPDRPFLIPHAHVFLPAVTMFTNLSGTCHSPICLYHDSQYLPDLFLLCFKHSLARPRNAACCSLLQPIGVLSGNDRICQQTSPAGPPLPLFVPTHAQVISYTWYWCIRANMYQDHLRWVICSEDWSTC